MKKVVNYLLLFVLTITGIFSYQMSVQAQSGTVYEGYAVNSNAFGMRYYITDGNSSVIAYCFNRDYQQPPLQDPANTLPQYTKLDYLTSNDSEVEPSNMKEKIAALLYVGYPNNATGLKEFYNLSEEEAIYQTQQALWQLVEGNEYFGFDNNYITKIGNHAVQEQYYGQGTFSFSGDLKMTKKDGVWRTGDIEITGDSREILEFDSIPANVKIMDVDFDTEIQGGLIVGDRFYLSYTGADDDLKEFELTYKTKEVSVDFYKWNTGTGNQVNKAYQNLINLVSEEKENKVAISVEKNTDSSNNGGNNTGNTTPILPQMNITVNINKYKKGTTDRVIGAELALYEGDSDQGNLVEKWTSTDQVKEIKVEAGKTYTLVELSAPEGYKLADPITFKTEKNSIVTDTSVNTVTDDTDYVAFRDGMKYITDGKNKWPVYCLNHSLTNPDYSSQIPDLSNNSFPHYRHWSLGNVSDTILFNNQSEKFTKNQLANLLLAGYPADVYGYQKTYNLSDDQAYNMIQTLLDEVLAGRTDAKDLSKISDETYKRLYGYYNDVLAAYLNPQIENAASKVDLFSWVQGTGTAKDKDYQTLAGVTPVGDDSTMEVIMEDEAVKTGTLELTKKDSDDGTLLADAEFGIYNEKDQLVATGKTNEKGVLTVTLELGKYYVKELKAPDKYVLDDTKHSFEILNENQKVSIEIFNKKDTNDSSNGGATDNSGNNNGSNGGTTDNSGNNNGSNGGTTDNSGNNNGSNGGTSGNTGNNNNSNGGTSGNTGNNNNSNGGTSGNTGNNNNSNGGTSGNTGNNNNSNGGTSGNTGNNNNSNGGTSGNTGNNNNSNDNATNNDAFHDENKAEVEEEQDSEEENVVDTEDDNKVAIDSYVDVAEDSKTETSKKEDIVSSSKDTKEKEKNKKGSVPNTGDSTELGVYMFGMLSSCLGVILLTKRKNFENVGGKNRMQ